MSYELKEKVLNPRGLYSVRRDFGLHTDPDWAFECAVKTVEMLAEELCRCYAGNTDHLYEPSPTAKEWITVFSDK